MTDPMIEAVARAMKYAALAEGWITEPVCDDQMDSFRILATAIEPMIRAQVEREIVAYLDQLDAERGETNLLAWAARKIEAGEHRRHHTNCAVVRNGNLRAWCDCGKGDDV